MTDLATLVPTLKREVAVPGTFATVYPETTDDDLVGSLMDAFAAAQIDGFFHNQLLNTDEYTVLPDLSQPGGAVVVIYAAERILTAQIMSLRQRSLYEAGPVKYEVENSAQVLTTILKQMGERKILILKQVTYYGGGFEMVDMFSDRTIGVEGLGISGTWVLSGLARFHSYELAR